MRLSEIRTIDELCEFAKSEAFYSVRGNFPFGVDAYWASSSNLRIDITKDGQMFWGLDKNMVPDNTEELFDNEHEATVFSLELSTLYLERRLKEESARLEKLRKDKNKEKING